MANRTSLREARAAARNPATPRTILRKLASHRNTLVRQAVAGNSQTPLRVLAKLAREFPAQLLANPALEHVLRQYAEVSSELPVAACIKRLKRPDCPVRFIEAMAQMNDVRIPLAIAMHPATPHHVLEALGPCWPYLLPQMHRSWIGPVRHHVNLDHGAFMPQRRDSGELGRVLDAEEHDSNEFYDARKLLPWLLARPMPGNDSAGQLVQWLSRQIELSALVRNPLAKPAELEKAATSASIEVLYPLGHHSARYPGVLAAINSVLYADPDLYVRNDTFNYYRGDRAQLTHIQGQVSDEMSAAGRHDPELLDRLARSVLPGTRVRVAMNPLTPRKSFLRLSRDHSPIVRKWVARNPFAPVSVLARLAQDEDYPVRLAAMQNPAPGAFAATDEDILRWLQSSEQKLRTFAASRPEASADVLTGLVGDEHPQVRALAASHAGLGASMLAKLAESDDPHVLRGLAFNPGAPPRLLRKLLDRLLDKARQGSVENVEREAIEQLLSRLNLPVSTMRSLMAEFVASGNTYLRMIASMSRHTPADKLHGIASSKNRAYLALNPAIPHEAMRQIIDGGDSWDRMLLTRNTHLPVDVLRKLAVSRDAELAHCARVALVAGKGRDCYVTGDLDRWWLSGPPEVRPVADPDLLLASCPGLARSMQAEFVRHRREDVRARFARNALLSMAALRKLEQDSAPAVRAAARAARASRSSRDYGGRKTVGQQGPDPFEVQDPVLLGKSRYLEKMAPADLRRLAKLEHLSLRQRENLRDSLSAALLSKHSRSTRPGLSRLACLLLPACGSEALTLASRSLDWKERLAVAAHPNTPAKTREQLSQDGNRFVRAAARHGN